MFTSSVAGTAGGAAATRGATTPRGAVTPRGSAAAAAARGTPRDSRRCSSSSDESCATVNGPGPLRSVRQLGRLQPLRAWVCLCECTSHSTAVRVPDLCSSLNGAAPFSVFAYLWCRQVSPDSMGSWIKRVEWPSAFHQLLVDTVFIRMNPWSNLYNGLLG